MILITGATGNVGSEVFRRLAGAGEPLRVLAREPSKLGAVERSVGVVRGDFDRRDSVRAALRSVEKVFLVALGRGGSQVLSCRS